MTNWRRAALGFASAVALAVLSGALALHAIPDPDRLKKEAREKARAAWSRDLDIGAAALELLPLPTLHAKDVALANPPWAKEPKLLQADRVTVRLALLPLLIGKLKVETISLEGVKASLEVSSDDAKSWEMHPAAEGPASTAPSASEWTGIGEWKIANADIRYRRKEGVAELWHVEGASVETHPGLRDVRIEAHVSRNRHPLHAKARFVDLSRLGEPGATSEAAIDLDWGKTQVAAEGRVALHSSMQGEAFNASLKSESLEDLLAFFGIERRRTARAEARAEVRESQGRVDVRHVSVALGKHRASGDAQLTLSEPKPIINVRLEMNRLDWVQALLEAGNAPLALLPEDELFYDRPLAWPLLVALQGTQGTIDVKFGSLLLRNGVELQHATAHMIFDGDRLDLAPFATELLGGSATGTMRFEGRKMGVRADVMATDILLERWFHERHRPIPFTGGPMRLRASVAATGASMKQLFASMTGPVSIRMGPGVYVSKAAGDWEARMVAFSRKDSTGEIDFECAGAALPFVSGRASGNAIVGARSALSRLLVSGYVDLREQAMDLRGRVRSKPGTGVGLSAIAGDIMIAGKIREMKVKLDPASTPAVIAKAGAAIATAGMSLVGSAVSNSSSSGPDPCEAVFTPQHPQRP